MKLYLRHKKTGKYYSEKGEWIKKASEALAFATVPAARRHAAKKGLKSANVVLKGKGIYAQMEMPAERGPTRTTGAGHDTDFFTQIPWLSK
jgi:hypothetical protein